MRDASLANYLRALGRHAGQTRVPCLDISSWPMPLTDIFVEPDVVADSADHPRKKGETPVNAIEVLASEQALAIVGEPGQGKSTLLKRYASELCADQGRGRLPLLIGLAEKRDKADDPKNFGWLWERIPASVKSRLGDEDLTALADALRHGQVAVLLDGLDELSKSAQEEVRALVGELIDHGNQVVITSRPHVYWAAPIGRFEVRRLVELNAGQMERLAERTCEAAAAQFGCRDVPRAVAAVLRASRGGAAAVAHNPLFLSFMCLSAVRRVAEERDEELPARPVTLIGDCLDLLVEWHKRSPRAWPDALSAERIIRVVGPLALKSLSADDAIRHSHVEDLTGDDKAVFHDYVVPARLVERRGGDFAFPAGMEVFREYFAAQAVARDDDPYALLQSHLHDPAWREVIVYAAGSLEKVEAWSIDLALPFATWLGVNSTKIVVSLIPGLIKLLGKPAEPIAEGAKEIAKEIGPKLQTPLEKKLKDSRRSVEYLVTRIMRHGSPYEAILGRDLRLAADCLANASDCTQPLAGRFMESVARAAVETRPCWMEVLRAIAPQGAFLGEAMQERMDAFASHENVTVRQVALRTRQSEARIERLLAALEHPERDVQISATLELSEMSQNPDLKRQLLLLTGMPEVFTKMDGEPRLQEGSRKQRERISREQRDRILKALEIDFNWYKREPALRALRRGANDADVRQNLIELLRDPNRAVRREAGLALPVDDPAVRLELLALTREGDAALRDDGTLLLWRAADDEEVRERLLQLTRDDDDRVRSTSVRQLAKAVGDPRIRARMVELIDDPSDYVRVHAVDALAEDLSNAESRAAIVSRLEAGEVDVQVRAIIAAAKLVGDRSVVEAIMVISRKSPDAFVRAACAKSLREAAASDNAACERLIELTRDPERSVRWEAVDALATVVSNPRVKAHLLDLTGDDDAFLRSRAAYLLRGVVSDPTVERRFRELIEDPDDGVFWLAVEALLEQKSLDVAVMLDRGIRRLSRGDSWVYLRVFEALVLAAEMNKRQPRARARAAAR
jgi:HEAT repeat protein